MATIQRPTSPPWSKHLSSSLPNHESDRWSLIEIKNGVEVAEHSLISKYKNMNQTVSRMIVIGRAEGLVDIVLHHDSISRFHARIAFDQRNIIWLRDLNSAHGVFVNKKRLPSNSIGVTETNSTIPGSRGVQIFPNDIIQFGASTRFFVVDGPAEYTRVNTDPIGTSTVPQEHQQSNEKHQNYNNGDVYSDEDDDIDSSQQQQQELREENVPDHLRSEYEKIKSLQYKVQNLTSESDRIQNKGDIDTLTHGQQQQLQRNEERIATILDQIQTREIDLLQKINGSNEALSIKKRKSIDKDDDDDDENDNDTFYDRTKSNRRTESVDLEWNKAGETEESLISKYSELQKRRKHISNKLSKLNEKEKQLKNDTTDDDEDNFFLQNEINLLIDTKRKLEDEEIELLQNMNDIQQMLWVVNPKIRWNDNYEIVTNDCSDDTSKQQQQRQTKTSMNHDVAVSQGVILSVNPLSSSSVIPTSEISCTQQQQSQQRSPSRGMAPPPPKRPRPTNVTSSSSVTTATKSTLAAITSITSTGTNTATTSTSHPSEQQHDGVTTTSLPHIIVNSTIQEEAQQQNNKNDFWQIPVDQDGSGRTKLNDKFAGRY